MKCITIMTEKQNQIPSLKEFIFPSDEIKKLVEDLEIFHQFQNQASVKLYSKWQGKKFFEGTFGEKIALDEIRELIDMCHGKQWQYLIKAIYLTKNYKTSIDMRGFHKLTNEHKIEIMEIISNGQKAYDGLIEWLAPINKENVLTAISDAVKTTLGTRKYDTFQILKYADIISKSGDGVILHENILEIDNPVALVEHFRMQKEPIHDSLILAFMRNEKYEFKPTVYMFFIWKNKFYILDIGERRLNLDNTAGARNPTRFYEKFDEVWLPTDIIFSDKKKSESKDIAVRDQKVFKRGNLFEIFKKRPEIKAWIDMFTYRIIDFIENNYNKIQQGVSTHDVIKQLEDKTEKKIPERVAIYDNHSSFESRNDASSYLLKKYQNNIKSVVPLASQVPMVIGTKKHVEGIIRYKQRTQVSEDLQKLILQDYKKNHKRVYKWFKDLVKKQNLTELVKKVFEDKEYSFYYYNTGFSTSDDGMEYVQGQRIKIDKSKKIQKRKVLTIYDEREDHIPLDHPDDPLIVTLTPTNSKYDKDFNTKQTCQICKKFKWNILVSLEFIDYRQICEFFNLKEDELPKEFVEHFHWQNEVYVGNSILDDTDPVDEIKDVWFRKKNESIFATVIVNDFSSEHPHLEIRIPLCRRCTKKYGGKLDVE